MLLFITNQIHLIFRGTSSDRYIDVCLLKARRTVVRRIGNKMRTKFVVDTELLVCGLSKRAFI